MQELRADAAIEADALGHILDVGAHFLAELGDLVDEGDLGCEEAVGGVFDELGGLDRRERDRRLDQVERPVKRAHDLSRPFGLGADHHAIRPHEIADRGALAQEFRVGDHVEAAFRPDPSENLRDLATGADGYRRFRDHHRVARHCAGDLLGRTEDVAQIGVTVASARGRTDRNEDRIGIRDSR